MKRNLWVMLILTLLASCALAQTPTDLRPEDSVYVFMRAFVNVDGSGVCLNNVPEQVAANMQNAPQWALDILPDLWATRQEMMRSLRPLIAARLSQVSPPYMQSSKKSTRSLVLAQLVAHSAGLPEALQSTLAYDMIVAILERHGLATPTMPTAAGTGLQCDGNPCVTCDCRKWEGLDKDCSQTSKNCTHYDFPVSRGGFGIQYTW